MALPRASSHGIDDVKSCRERRRRKAERPSAAHDESRIALAGCPQEIECERLVTVDQTDHQSASDRADADGGRGRADGAAHPRGKRRHHPVATCRKGKVFESPAPVPEPRDATRQIHREIETDQRYRKLLDVEKTERQRSVEFETEEIG